MSAKDKSSFKRKSVQMKSKYVPTVCSSNEKPDVTNGSYKPRKKKHVFMNPQPLCKMELIRYYNEYSISYDLFISTGFKILKVTGPS